MCILHADKALLQTGHASPANVGGKPYSTRRGITDMDHRSANDRRPLKEDLSVAETIAVVLGTCLVCGYLTVLVMSIG